MTVLNILAYPNPILQKKSAPVTNFDQGLKDLASNMIDTLHAFKSIGLSSPQIGVAKRLLVMDHSGNQTKPEVFVNPEIIAQGRYGFVEESCLSIPGLVANAFRPTLVKVKAKNLDGETFEQELDGMPAVCLHHEMDHLNGKLLLDRVSWLKRRRYQRAAAKLAS